MIRRRVALLLSAAVFGLAGAGPLTASSATADAQLGAILGLYAALHGAVTALVVVALSARRVPVLGSVAAAVGALLAWLLVGMMDALGPSFGHVEPELVTAIRVAAAVALSFAVLAFLVPTPSRAEPE